MAHISLTHAHIVLMRTQNPYREEHRRAERERALNEKKKRKITKKREEVK